MFMPGSLFSRTLSMQCLLYSICSYEKDLSHAQLNATLSALNDQAIHSPDSPAPHHSARLGALLPEGELKATYSLYLSDACVSLRLSSCP